MRISAIVLVGLFLASCTGLRQPARPTLLPSETLTASPTSSPSSFPSPSSTTTETPTQPPPGPTLPPTTQAPPSPVAPLGQGELEAYLNQLRGSGAYGWRIVLDGLPIPVGLANAGDGSGRLFVIEKGGRIHVVKDGVLQPVPFLDIVDRVGSGGSERGLLGLAFHPRYLENGYFFVNYTDVNGNTVIARFQVSSTDPDRADPASELRLIQVDQPFPNHNGGSLVFGPDGYLYLGLGDGGSAGDPHGNGQSLTTLLGKILRIDVNSADGYSIPPENPFVNSGPLPEIWAYGLRNPWRIAFDSLTGDLYIADVGQNSWEEIDFLPAGTPGGVNFGWNFMEGAHFYHGEPAGRQLTPPVAEYGHNLGCSVTGGVVYRGTQLPEWAGIYLYGDYCSGRVWGLLHDSQGSWASAVLFETLGSITSFGVDEAGEVYLVNYGGQLLILARN